MSRYRIEYTDEARDSLRKMAAGTRREFESGMSRLAGDPYGHGSTPAKGRREPDRRSATVSGFFVVYYVSSTVLTLTTVHIIGG
ncbi:type II toxin-antitoxin system RelE family toxin [Streptomyces sp. NPDC001889]